MKRIIILIITVSLMFTALFSCTKQENTETDKFAWLLDESDDGILPAVNPILVKGDIITAGSSTVFPLSERMVERFREEGYSGNITVDSIGSGAGFERFCVAGETDISNASRPIKQKEFDTAVENGRTPIEFLIGVDALAVVVSKENDFITNATLEELKMIFSSASKWSDINPSWPENEILRFIPGTDSGTFDYFVEEVFDDEKEMILNADNLQMSEDDNVLVQGILGSPYAIGFFGYAYYVENKGKLNVLNIEGVRATAENVEGGNYPLARPLFIYSSANIMQEKPQVAAFINFYLTYVNEEIKAIGYFPVNEDTLKTSKDKWLNAMEGFIK
jgi:phosphate transport system substrate-binding protein